MIDMTRSDEPSLVCEPRSLIPRAKIVGNMSDIKKLVSKIAIIPAHPGRLIPNASKTMFVNAKPPSILFGLIRFIK